MVGSNSQVVTGAISTVSIAGGTYNLKRIWNLVKDHPLIRDANSSGADYTFGRNNHSFSITIEASTPDLSAIDAFTNETANGDLTSLAIIISMPPIGGGATVTASFNCKIHHAELGHPSEEGKILVRLDAVITSSTITWG